MTRAITRRSIKNNSNEFTIFNHGIKFKYYCTLRWSSKSIQLLKKGIQNLKVDRSKPDQKQNIILK